MVFLWHFWNAKKFSKSKICLCNSFGRKNLTWTDNKLFIDLICYNSFGRQYLTWTDSLFTDFPITLLGSKNSELMSGYLQIFLSFTINILTVQCLIMEFCSTCYRNNLQLTLACTSFVSTRAQRHTQILRLNSCFCFKNIT